VAVRLGQGSVAEITEPIVPSIYAAQLVQLATRFHVDAERLLARTGLHVAQLDDARTQLSPAVFAELILRALTLTGEPGLGFYYGLQLKLSSHGAVGLAAMASATLGDAIRVAERFLMLRAPYLQLAATVHGEGAVLTLGTSSFQQVDPRLLVFTTESLFTALVQIASMLLGHGVTGMVELAYPEPAHFPGFAHLWPGPARFSRPSSRLMFAASLLREPLQMADEVAARRALSECERELSTLHATSSLLASLRRQLGDGSSFPSLTELARLRGVSPRTLKRRLAEQGTSYRQLLDEARRDRALSLLESDATVEDIGRQLGYSDAANFNRAFRRWLGLAPSEWRGQHARQEPARSSGK
jgi:AraC-like DNA-binding protein